MFTHLTEILLSFVTTLPLGVFAFFASFVEEIVAPIPSPGVMIATGSIASVQGYPLYMLIVLACIAAFGKTLGALTVYAITAKAEYFIMKKFGYFFGVTHDDVARLGSKLGKGTRDYFLLTALRAFPFMPSVVLSVGSGLLKIPLPLFITATFLGTIIRDSIYLYFGFVGTEALGAFIAHSANIETILEVCAVITAIAILGYLYARRRVT